MVMDWEFVLFLAVFQGIVFGFFCSSLASAKGYKLSMKIKYFILGLLFSFIGLLYVGFLPLAEDNAFDVADYSKTRL